ncbi:MAG TPA: hypothetical protein VJ986_04195 [Gaiellaceae bacterium]|nr:hypothetical protein [Gaiellaceae bacterium]
MEEPEGFENESEDEEIMASQSEKGSGENEEIMAPQSEKGSGEDEPEGSGSR